MKYLKGVDFGNPLLLCLISSPLHNRLRDFRPQVERVVVQLDHVVSSFTV